MSTRGDAESHALSCRTVGVDAAEESVLQAHAVERRVELNIMARLEGELSIILWTRASAPAAAEQRCRSEPRSLPRSITAALVGSQDASAPSVTSCAAGQSHRALLEQALAAAW